MIAVTGLESVDTAAARAEWLGQYPKRPRPWPDTPQDDDNVRLASAEVMSGSVSVREALGPESYELCTAESAGRRSWGGAGMQTGTVDWHQERIEGWGNSGSNSWALVSYVRPPLTRPSPLVHPSARAHITDRVQSVLNMLCPILVQEAQRNFVVVTKTEISAFRDPEEDTVEIVVTQWVKLPAASALEYWDRVGRAIQYWSMGLPPELERIALERLAIEVEWGEESLSVP